MPETKEFPIEDVLSIMTGFVLSSRGLEGVHDFFQYMGGVPYSEEDLDNCRLFVSKQFPCFASQEFSQEVARLEEKLEKASGGKSRDLIVEEWLSRQSLKFGRMLRIEQIPIQLQRSSSIH